MKLVVAQAVLADDESPQLKAAAKAMLARLDAEAKTGAPLAYIPGADKKVANKQCNANATQGKQPSANFKPTRIAIRMRQPS